MRSSDSTSSREGRHLPYFCPTVFAILLLHWKKQLLSVHGKMHRIGSIFTWIPAVASMHFRWRKFAGDLTAFATSRGILIVAMISTWQLGTLIIGSFMKKTPITAQQAAALKECAREIDRLHYSSHEIQWLLIGLYDCRHGIKKNGIQKKRACLPAPAGQWKSLRITIGTCLQSSKRCWRSGKHNRQR